MSEPKWLTVARAELGVAEIEGPKSNSRVVEYAKVAAGVAAPDAEAWCASFVGWCLEKDGLSSTSSSGKRNARSYLDVGKQLDKPVLGCIVVFWRGSPNGWQGHVAFFIKEDATHIWVLGGNQSNKVSIAKYPKSQLLGYRWPEGVAPPKVKSAAAADESLRQAQKRLVELGYFEVGEPDGLMGSKSRGALLAFKADWNEDHAGTKDDLPLSDAYDAPVLAALMAARPRTVSVERLTATEAVIADHSAVKDAKKISIWGRVLALFGLGGAGVEGSKAVGFIDQAEQVQGIGVRVWSLVEPVAPLLIRFWPFILIALGVAYVVWSRRVRREEIESYRAGETP